MRRASLAALILAGSATIHGATAQGLSDSVLTATISQSLEADSNFDLDPDSPGTTVFGDTRFELGILQETDTDVLSLGFNTALRALDQPDEPFEFTLGSPTGALFDYARENPNSTFDTLLRYRQRRTTFTRDLDEFVDEDGFLPDDLTEDLDADAREHRFDAEAGIAYGTNAPSTYALRFSGTTIDYSNDNTNLTPRRSGEVEGAWTLRVTPVLSTIVAATYFQYDADNAQDTEIQIAELDAGLVYNPSENLRVRGGVGYAEREESNTNFGGQRITEKNTGPTLRGDLRYEQENFTLVGDARLTTAAPETRLAFVLRGNYNLARGRVVGRVFNRYTGASTSGDEEQVTGIGIGLERDINSVSRFGLDFAVANQNNLDNSADPDITRTSVTATYDYDLTRVVTAQVGYQFQNRIEDPDDATSQRVFVNIARTFQTGL